MAEVSHALALLRQETSITDEVLGALNTCQSGTKLDANARSAIKNALVLLRGKEAKLAKAGEALHAHQELHAEVESLRQEVKSGERQVLDCARRLAVAEAALRGPLKDASRILEEGRKAEASEIAVGDIVDYAQRISGITSAPSYWKPGMAMVGFAPPAPRPEMMRAGALSAFAVATGTSLPASELLKIAHDLDNPPDQTRNAARNADDGAEGSDDDNSSSRSSSSSGSPGNPRTHEEKDGQYGSEGSPKRRGVKRSGDGGEEGGGGGGGDGGGISPGGGKRKTSKSASASGASFARPTPPKRPKISLDLDDLDSDDDSSDED
eukprot:g7490.t1